ncbi:MAG TPA: hypothetical protein VFB58_06890 [Chloroflexota bacterium]|nr:hypothetical protein [Chloroflexota bacterium]
MHYPVVVAPRGDQPGLVYAGVRLAGTRAGHYDPAMPIMHGPWQFTAAA